MRLSLITAPVVAVIVGFGGTLAIIIAAARAAGANEVEVASWVSGLCLAMAATTGYLSLRHRIPIVTAWSTPGAALLATTGVMAGGFAAAVGAFLISSALIVLAGLWKPLGRWVAALPPALANAMLAGVLLTFCLAPVRAVAEGPALALPVILAWALAWRFQRLFAIPVALIVALVMIAVTTDLPALETAALLPQPVLVLPTFSLAALVSIALPLFIVTMASQNIPGIAVLNANGFSPAPGPLFVTSGVFSLLSAPFGGHAVNLAAITAALCAGEEAHPDPARRYWAAATSGLFYIVFGLFAGVAAAFITASPPILMQAVAGLALLGAFGNAVLGAVQEADSREAAVITFLVTASGLSFYGISGAFWGLIAGGAVLALARWRRKT